MTLSYEKFLSSQRASTELIGAVTRESGFLTDDHLQAVKKEKSEVKNPV